MDSVEDILTETNNRFVLYPIKYTPIWNMYKTAVSAFWQVEEIDLSKDIDHWEFIMMSKYLKHAPFILFKWLWKLFILKCTLLC